MTRGPGPAPPSVSRGRVSVRPLWTASSRTRVGRAASRPFCCWPWVTGKDGGIAPTACTCGLSPGPGQAAAGMQAGLTAGGDENPQGPGWLRVRASSELSGKAGSGGLLPGGWAGGVLAAGGPTGQGPDEVRL